MLSSNDRHYSYIGLVVDSELPIRTIGRSRLELLAIELESERLFGCFSLFGREWHLETKDSVLLGYSWHC